MISRARIGNDQAAQNESGLARSRSLAVVPRPGSVEQADAREYRREIVTLFEGNGRAEFRDQFDWYYRNDGQETPDSWLLRDESGRIRGLISVTVRPLHFGSMTIRAGVAGNLLVDRNSGIYFGASSLVRAAQSLIKNNSVDILLGIPNGLSQPVFHRMKFRTLDHWRTFAQVFRSRDLLHSHFGFAGTLASPYVDFYAAMRRVASDYYGAGSGPQIVDLGETELGKLPIESWLRSHGHLTVASTAEYLKWRFLRDPIRKYQIKGVRAVSGELCGYLVLRQAAGRLWIVDCDVDLAKLTKLKAIVCFCRYSNAKLNTIWVASLSSALLSRELPKCGFAPVNASTGGYPDSPLVGFWREDHPLAGWFSQASSWDLLPGFNDV